MCPIRDAMAEQGPVHPRLRRPWTRRGPSDTGHIRSSACSVIEAERDRARLVHRGVEPIAVDLGDASFVAVAWRGWYEEAARVEGRFADARASASDGWAVDIPLDGLTGVEHDVTVHVHTRFRLGAEPDAVDVELAHAPELQRPSMG